MNVDTLLGQRSPLPCALRTKGQEQGTGTYAFSGYWHTETRKRWLPLSVLILLPLNVDVSEQVAAYRVVPNVWGSWVRAVCLSLRLALNAASWMSLGQPLVTSLQTPAGEVLAPAETPANRTSQTATPTSECIINSKETPNGFFLLKIKAVVKWFHFPGTLYSKK